MATILYLPNEILSKIFNFLYYVDDNFNIHGNKNDILASRLVCTKLAAIGRHYYFEHITFINDIKGYSNLLKLSQSPAANSVRRLSCYFQAFDTVSPEFIDLVFGWRQLEIYKVHRMYELQYLPRNRHQTRLQARDLDIGIFNKAIPSFKRLRAINFMQDFSDRYGDIFHIIEPEVNTVFAQSPLGRRLFDAMTNALSISSTRIEALQLGSIEDIKNFENWSTARKLQRLHVPAMLSTIEGLTMAKLESYQNAFGKLKRLNIRLESRVINLDGLSAFIHSAPLLEELWLQFVSQHEKPLTSKFMKSFKLRRLQIFQMDLAVIEDSFCLIEFLSKHATHLKTVSFRELELKTGSWETVFIEMRKLLNLKSICIRGAFQTEESIEVKSGLIEHGRIVLGDEAIEDFIQHRTDNNPFVILRSTRKVFPPHPDGDWQCGSWCPYRGVA